MYLRPTNVLVQVFAVLCKPREGLQGPIMCLCVIQRTSTIIVFVD